ncbi:hypothetical protein [Acidihalobacter ferrooxydans]|uniref:Cation/multidrug efflux pump n=1 Tax=Acidihalobacter ferrooxydans TaxID=1765967 RepID=A0A1P8UDC5_9GAMM|nr:hypothetical protein [Acidihalobacter ferrooxydans]APZ41845.1 hypothetical protein BW247_00985 [Acidihalobacter ferrooxydans]
MISIALFGGLVIVLVVLGLLGLVRGAGHLRNGRLVRAGLRGTLSSLMIAAAALFGLGALNLTTYQQLVYEQPVGSISFRGLGPGQYEAKLQRPSGATSDYVLRGQDWELQARVLKWRNWLALIGFHPRYQLSRLEGRYTDIAQARSARRTVYALAPTRGFDAWARAGWLKAPLVDALYGSAVYLPMAAGARYTVSLGQTGLIARPANARARQAVAAWH